MNGSFIEFLFTVGFMLIGSSAFHISALISGYNIYREFSSQESNLLSIVVGFVILLLSPISIIIFSDYTNLLVQIIDFKVLLAFFSSAFGLGLIFGGAFILGLRWHFLHWLRDKLKMKFWIAYYGFVWDDLFSMVKKNGEIFVKTHDTMINGLLHTASIRNEPREIILVMKELKEDVLETIDKSKYNITRKEENVKILIPGSEIKRIIVPERSFKKHFETMDHISQAFYCFVIAIGFLFLSISTYLTKNYIIDLEYSGSLESFYNLVSIIFLVSVFLLLICSLITAKKDYNNLRAFLALCPCYNICIPVIFLVIILYFMFYVQLSKINLSLLIIIFIITMISIVYIKIKFKNPVKECFDEILNSVESQKLLESVIQDCYLQLNCIDYKKENIDFIKNEIFHKYEYDLDKNAETKRDILEIIIDKLANLKTQNKCLDREDFNIILKFMNHMEKKKGI